MRAFSSVVSVALHVGLGLAVLFGSARTGRSNPRAPDTISMVFPQPAPRTTTSGIWAPSGPPTVVNDVGTIRVPNFTLQTGARAPAPFPAGPAPFSTATVSGSAPGWVAVGSENGPEVLTGPLPHYPEMLRQAGVQGRVILEAVVDTTGRVNRDSIDVVSATHYEFVAAARQALLATLFRPAFVFGRLVRVRVRIPYEFTIRNGMGRAH